MSKKVVVIGAGVSGLVAGIYARLAGFDVEIFESHSIVGGNCTGWYHKGYHVDGCIQWLTGTKKGTGVNQIWQTCGALSDEVGIYHMEKIATTVYEGKTYHLYVDLEKTEHEFLAVSPGDKAEIRKLMKNIRCFRNLNIPIEKPFEDMNKWKLVPLLWKMLRSGKPEKKTEYMTIAEYISEFKSPVIRQLLACIFPTVMPAFTLFYCLGIRSSGDGGWPMGGSLAFMKRMQGRFEELGGRMHTGTAVDKIIIKEDTAVGVEIKNDNREVFADYIISAVDADMLLNRLLEGKYPDEYFDKRFATPQDYLLLTGSYVSLGVAADLSAYPHNVYVQPEKPFRLNRTELKHFNVKIYNFDPAFAKDGKTVMAVLLTEDEIDYWKALKKESDHDYKAEKERLANWVIGGIVKVFPEIEDKIEMSNTATSLTFHRYCNSYRGTYMSFIPSGHVKKQIHKGVKENIKNLYIAGQCTFPAGGLPLAAIAGKFAAQRIIKAEKIS
ncbi:MAG: NAD(P)/FAD-dependent oxidoreductase [Tannerella sp.]|jgi:phytoene dehydrogenase-like protein|nr:NAD(P)/FAD-dependent oxidoreductase [Tannerella sp.]